MCPATGPSVAGFIRDRRGILRPAAAQQPPSGPGKRARRTALSVGCPGGPMPCIPGWRAGSSQSCAQGPRPRPAVRSTRESRASGLRARTLNRSRHRSPAAALPQLAGGLAPSLRACFAAAMTVPSPRAVATAGFSGSFPWPSPARSSSRAAPAPARRADRRRPSRLAAEVSSKSPAPPPRDRFPNGENTIAAPVNSRFASGEKRDRAPHPYRTCTCGPQREPVNCLKNQNRRRNVHEGSLIPGSIDRGMKGS